MVIRQRGLSRCFATRPIWEEAVILGCELYLTRTRYFNRRTSSASHSTFDTRNALKRSRLSAFTPRKRRNPGAHTERPGFQTCSIRSLTITYFHTGIRTIIGVESFHGPVRDGKGWDRLAMVIRHEGCRAAGVRNATNLEEAVKSFGL